MARPLKQGLIYFPFDVDFFSDMKIRRLKKDCGNQSILVLVWLLCSIYQGEGYYIRLHHDLAFLIAEEFGINERSVQESVQKAVHVGLFDSDMLNNHQILTSSGIQARYEQVCRNSKKRMAKIKDEYRLIPKIEDNDAGLEYAKIINSGGNSINSGGNEVNSVKKYTKGKERKEKDISRMDIKSHRPSITDEGLAVFSHFQELFPQASPNQLSMITSLVKIYGSADVVAAIDRTFERGKKDLMYTAGILRKWRESDERGVPRDRRSGNGQNRTSSKAGGDESEPSAIANRWRTAK